MKKDPKEDLKKRQEDQSRQIISGPDYKESAVG